jgi:hypothetical protein
MKGDFITMLAPIRLYLFRPHNALDPAAIPLLTGVKTYYYAQLTKYGAAAPGHPDFKGGAWINTEDMNVERLIALDLSTAENLETSYIVCQQFFLNLFFHKPRPTALRSVILALPENHPTQTKFWPWSFSARLFAKTRILTSKGRCILILGILAATTSQTREALELFG